MMAAFGMRNDQSEGDAVARLGQTIADLIRQQQRQISQLSRWWTSFRVPAHVATPNEAEAPEAGLVEVADFGANPGALRMLVYLPKGLSRGAPLVVVLHGCTQSAAAFDRACGWSDLAPRFGFTLLLPEQRQANHANACFNWFAVADTRRGGGEALSIREMVDRMVTDHGLDPGRVYVMGLSAGGAMAMVMLATYPEVFAGGAIIGGLPYGSAANSSQARPAMEGRQNNRAATDGATQCGPPRPTVGPGRGSRSGTATPTHPCTRSTPSGSWNNGPIFTASPARLRWRSGPAVTCTRSGVHPMARRWSRATPSPA